jgi:hypothetical protein
LTVQNGEKAVDNVDVETTWRSLATRAPEVEIETEERETSPTRSAAPR